MQRWYVCLARRLELWHWYVFEENNRYYLNQLQMLSHSFSASLYYVWHYNECKIAKGSSSWRKPAFWIFKKKLSCRYRALWYFNVDDSCIDFTSMFLPSIYISEVCTTRKPCGRPWKFLYTSKLSSFILIVTSKKFCKSSYRNHLLL